MALQTSGAISLNDIHQELGATSGTTVSLNDTDVRGLVSIASGAIDLGDFYGASSWTATHTLTQGSFTSSGNTYNGKFATVTGSISPTTYSGYAIYTLARYDMASGSDNLWFYLSGTVPATAFSTLEFTATDGTIVSLDSSDASTSQLGGSYRYWTWDSADFDTGHYTKFQTTFDGSGNIDVLIS
jgi:hypothetical protein